MQPNWLSLPPWLGSLPAEDLCFALRAAHGRSYSRTISCFRLSSARTQRRRVRVAAGGSPWGFRESLRSPCSTDSEIHAFNDLPVTKFALTEENKAFLTPQYSFALAQNFRPERDYQANIGAVKQPLRVLAGQNDEVFYADKFASVFKTAGKDVPVTLLPGINHISLTLDSAAIEAAVAAVESHGSREA